MILQIFLLAHRTDSDDNAIQSYDILEKDYYSKEDITEEIRVQIHPKEEIEIKQAYADPIDYQSKLDTFRSLVSKQQIKVIVKDIDEEMNNKNIISQYIRKKSGEKYIEVDTSLLESPRLMDTLYHEYGHYIWFEIITPEQQDEWSMVISSRGYLNEYGSSSTEEDWAEYFTVFLKEKDPFQKERYCDFYNQGISEERVLLGKHTVMRNILNQYEVNIHPFTYFKNSCTE